MARVRKPRFSRKRRSRRSGNPLFSWWVLWRVPVLLGVVSAAWWYLYRPYAEEQGWVQVSSTFALCGERWGSKDGCVVDGDTLVLGDRAQRRRIRLTGFDAPEMEGACPAESAQALRAQTALHEWLSRGRFEWSGEGDPPRDQYGRELRELRRVLPDEKREYLAEWMIERGLAAESGWGTSPVDWCE